MVIITQRRHIKAITLLPPTGDTKRLLWQDSGISKATELRVTCFILHDCRHDGQTCGWQMTVGSITGIRFHARAEFILLFETETKSKISVFIILVLVPSAASDPTTTCNIYALDQRFRTFLTRGALFRINFYGGAPCLPYVLQVNGV